MELYDLTVANLGPATQYVTFTTDGPSDGMLTCGRLAGKAYSTVDFGPGNAHNPFATMRKYEPVGPYQNSEFYPGWLDHWKEKHQRTGAEPILKTMTEMYEMDANWNFYVFIGGTNWGFMSGANGGGKSFQPQPTSSRLRRAAERGGRPHGEVLRDPRQDRGVEDTATVRGGGLGEEEFRRGGLHGDGVAVGCAGGAGRAAGGGRAPCDDGEAGPGLRVRAVPDEAGGGRRAARDGRARPRVRVREPQVLRAHRAPGPDARRGD